MDGKEGNGMMGLERLNALFNWWGMPNSGAGANIEAQIKRFQSFAADLQRTYGEAYSAQLKALYTANERLARSFQELAHCRQPQEVIAAESNILATLLEGASLQAKTWADVTQKIQACCASMAREAAEEMGKSAAEKR
jgi:hypothetical protein